MRFLLLFLLLNNIVTAQTFRVFEITPAGKLGSLLRTETYVADHLVRSQHYAADGTLHYEVNYDYDAAGHLTDRVQTFKKDHEFDLIRQYDHDEQGRKIGELFGNNRTGKWGSYRFNYNPQGDLDTVFVYQKNGELSNLRTFDITYDTTNRKVSERIDHVDLDPEETERGLTFNYQYSADGRTTTVTEIDAQGQVNSVETTTLNEQGKPTTVTITMRAEPPLKTQYRYNQRGYVIEIREFTDNKPSLTTTQQFNDQGIRVEKKYRFADGTYGGERYRKNNPWWCASLPLILSIRRNLYYSNATSAKEPLSFDTIALNSLHQCTNC